LVSLSGAQSVNIVKLLIIIERPSPKIVRAIEATAAWLESAFIEGRRVIEHPEDNRQGKNWMAFHKLTFASYCWTKDVIRRYESSCEKLTGGGILAVAA
jgi:PelA/Pel-15E family pectate lyase